MCVKQRKRVSFSFFSFFFFHCGVFLLFFFFSLWGLSSLSLFSLFSLALSLFPSPPPLSSLFSLLSSSLIPEPDGRGVQGPGTN